MEQTEIYFVLFVIIFFVFVLLWDSYDRLDASRKAKLKPVKHIALVMVTCWLSHDIYYTTMTPISGVLIIAFALLTKEYEERFIDYLAKRF